MAVGLRCGKAGTETPRCRVQLESVFLVIAVAALLFFLSRKGRQDLLPRPPSPAGLQGGSPLRWVLVAPTRATRLNASTGYAGPLSPARTLPHVGSALLATVEQDKLDTARRASGDSTTSGQINRT